ncbi:ARM repeat-containing protein [Trametopsis cervina]|nr:ARM repeat-containing protein [Trametopsis cervina]
MASEVAQCLAATLSSDNNTRVAAELRLSKLSESPETGLALARLIITPDADATIRQMSYSASIVLRKYVKERWSPYFTTFRGSAPPVEIKTQIRDTVFQGLSDPVRKIRTSSANTLTTIASCDWPDEYPGLLDALLNLLSSGSPDAVHGAMQMFTDFVKSELTEDQLLPTLRQLLPVLLNILGDAEHHSPLTRARTIAVYRQCIEALYMVKEEHPESVKEASSSVLPVWLDAFKVLMNLDPKADVVGASNWDGLAVRIQVIKTLDIIHTSFPRVLAPYLPDFLNSTLHHLGALFPEFFHYYITAENTPPFTSEDERVDLTQLAGSALDFISAVARSGRAKQWFNEEKTTALLAEVFRWIEMTADEESEWGNDANAFVVQESDESTTYSVRVAGCDLLEVLLDRDPSLTLASLNKNTHAVVQQSSALRDSGNDHWWRQLEAVFTALGSVSGSILEIVQEQATESNFDVASLLTGIVPTLLTMPQYPFLQGRAFVFASQFSRVLPSDMAGQYVDAVVHVLEAQDITVPVKVSAIRAIRNFCTECPDTAIVPRAAQISKNIEIFLPIVTSDTLSLVLDALSALVRVQKGSWLTPQLVETLVPAILNTWVKNVQDPHFMAVMSTILSRLASAPVAGLYETVARQALPPLCEAIRRGDGDDKWIAAAALEQISGLLQGAPEGHIGSGFIETLAPALFGCLRATKDRDAIQYGITCLTLIVRKDCPQLLAWKDATSGKSGIDCVLELIAWQLQTDDESGSLFIGDLIIHLMRRAGDSILPILQQLLEAMATRMTTAKTATFIQSLVIPFAFLIHNGQRDTVLTLLESINISGRSGLDVVIQTWCENAETFQGFWVTRTSTLALVDLFVCARPSLQALQVKGDLIMKEETKHVIMTRSRTKKSMPQPEVPTEFTRIPFPVKALKLILQEMQANGEPASMGYGGLNSSDIQELRSDDGEEEWSDDEAAEGPLGAKDVSFLSDMLGAPVPPEMLAALGGGSFEDVSYEGDDEDLMRDPSVQIDLRAHIATFLRESANNNTNNFSALIGYLKPEEMMVIQKVVS